MNQAVKHLISAGWDHHQRGNFDAAADFYRHAIQLDSRNFDCWHLLGLSLIQKGLPADAVTPLNRAAELQPENFDALIHFGTALAQNGQPEQAIIQFQAAQQIHPKSPVAHLNTGLALATLARFDEAKISFTKLLSLEPNNPVALLNLGRIESELGNSESAIKIFAQLDKAHPGEKSIALMYAMALHKADDHESALNKIEACLKCDANFTDAINCKGIILRALGRSNEALASFKTAVELSPNHSVYLGHLGALENELGDFTSAQHHLRRACEISPETPDLLVNYGLSLAKQGMNVEAIEQYRKALAIAPSSIDALNNLGASLIKLDALEEAERALTIALEINANSVATIYNLAKCYNKANRHSEAIELCLRAIQKEPENAELYIEISSGYAAMGLPVKACEYLKLGLENAGDNPILLNNLGTTESDMGAFTDAMLHLNMSETADPDYPEPKFNKSLIQIKTLELEEGWNNFEFRWSTQKFDSVEIKFSCPKWNGETCNSLVIWKEQGIGDQVLFCTLLKKVKQLVPNIMVIIDSRLIPMMSASYPGIKFVDSKTPLTNKRIDFHLPMGSLPRLFCKNLDAIINKPFTFLTAHANKREEVKNLLGSRNRARLGIAWRSTNNPGAQSKSIDLDLLLISLDQEKYELVNLQYGDVTNEICRAQENNPNLLLRSFPQLDLYNDVDTLAALIENCDLILTSSNATAHFAGVIGKPTIVITPYALGKHWYWWHTKDEQSLWYPTVHVLSQGEDLDWEPALRRAKELLPELINS